MLDVVFTGFAMRARYSRGGTNDIYELGQDKTFFNHFFL
jgi:hypothetical protein